MYQGGDRRLQRPCGGFDSLLVHSVLTNSAVSGKHVAHLNIETSAGMADAKLNILSTAKAVVCECGVNGSMTAFQADGARSSRVTRTEA